MSSRADDAFLAAVAAVAGAFRELPVRAMIIGGVAVIARGVPRLTVDVDGTVWGEGLSLDALFDTLERHDVVPRIADARDFARARDILLMRHQPSGTPVEISLAGLLFEREALERATFEDIAGIVVPVARAEDLIIYKAVAWRHRDRADVERLLVLHGPRVDLGRIRAIVSQVAEVLEEPSRLGELEAIIDRVREATGEGP